MIIETSREFFSISETCLPFNLQCKLRELSRTSSLPTMSFFWRKNRHHVQPLSHSWSVTLDPSLWQTFVTERSRSSVLQLFVLLCRGNIWGLRFENLLIFLHRYLNRFKWKFRWKNGKNFWLPGTEVVFEKLFSWVTQSSYSICAKPKDCKNSLCVSDQRSKCRLEFRRSLVSGLMGSFPEQQLVIEPNRNAEKLTGGSF